MSGTPTHGFKRVFFQYGQIHVAGGFLRKSEPVVSKIVPDSFDPSNPAKSKTFVKLSTNEPWLVMAVTGQKNHALGRTTLLTLLHKHVVSFEKPCSVVTEQEEEEGDDPMDAIDAAVETPKKKRRVRYPKKTPTAKSLSLTCQSSRLKSTPRE